MIIFRSIGPVISTRRSMRSAGMGATVQAASRTSSVSERKWGRSPASKRRCRSRRRSRRAATRGPKRRHRSATSASAVGREHLLVARGQVASQDEAGDGRVGAWHGAFSGVAVVGAATRQVLSRSAPKTIDPVKSGSYAAMTLSMRHGECVKLEKIARRSVGLRAARLTGPAGPRPARRSPMATTPQLGAKVRALRRARSMTQAQLAQRLGISAELPQPHRARPAQRLGAAPHPARRPLRPRPQVALARAARPRGGRPARGLRRSDLRRAGRHHR